MTWDKGLTKETDERIRLRGEKISRALKGKKMSEAQRGAISQSLMGKKLSDAHKASLRKTVKRKVEEVTWHHSFSKRRRHEYAGVSLDGKWELAYAKHLDAKGIKWRRPTESFPYEFEGETHQYHPDFQLVESGEYVEIKGWPVERDRAKWKAFPHKLTVLGGQELFDLGLIESFKRTK